MGYPEVTLDDDMARHHADSQAAIDRVYAEIRPQLQGDLRNALDRVLAGALHDQMEGWKAHRFDTLKDLANGDFVKPSGYVLKPDDRQLQEPAHITKARERLRDAYDNEIADKPSDPK